MFVTQVRRALLAAILVVCFGAPSGASASSRHDATEASIIRALNQARVAQGLPRLKASRGLAKAADAHSRAMKRANRVGHGDYSRRLRRYVQAQRVGENLAWRRGCNARAIVKMWLASAPHRQIIMRRAFRRVGVGRAGSSLCLVTADFASAK